MTVNLDKTRWKCERWWETVEKMDKRNIDERQAKLRGWLDEVLTWLSAGSRGMEAALLWPSIGRKGSVSENPSRPISLISTVCGKQSERARVTPADRTTAFWDVWWNSPDSSRIFMPTLNGLLNVYHKEHLCTSVNSCTYSISQSGGSNTMQRIMQLQVKRFSLHKLLDRKNSLCNFNCVMFLCQIR